jgi:hypothetical protein
MTGKITIRELQMLMLPLLSSIVVEFQIDLFLELGSTEIIVRG